MPWFVERHLKIVWQDSGGPGNETYATQHPILLIVHEQLGDPKIRTCVAQLDNSTEAEFNAKLIAAAPDLFASLVDLLSCHPSFNSPYDPSEYELEAIHNARQAIEKATGKTKA